MIRNEVMTAFLYAFSDTNYNFKLKKEVGNVLFRTGDKKNHRK